MEGKVESAQRHRGYAGYIPIYTRTLAIDSILEFDIYIFDGREMVLYRSKNLPLTSESCRELLKRNYNRLYIKEEQRRAYQRYVRANIGQVLADVTVDDFTKSSIVYDCAKELVRDIFADPTRCEHVQESQIFVESTVLYVLEGKNAFMNMLKVMSFDYSVFTHSVNVCTFSLALAHATGMDRTQELTELATGALLHDVGKARIPDTILHKPGPLNGAEWETMRQHPKWGVEIMSKTDLIPDNSYIPIAQHHERSTGNGYPDKLKGSDIHPYSRIVAIADAFDAMTTNRVYRAAGDTFSTLKTMRRPDQGFDDDLLTSFIKLMGPIRPDIVK